MNIILTGMPGAGKSTTGVILAKALGKDFIDTDLVIQRSRGRLLQEIIDKDGIEAFIKTEGDIIISLDVTNTVIATGGSVVLNPGAMEHLKELGIVLYLKLTLEEITSRINNIKTRGIVIEKGQSLGDVYMKRSPLYEKYMDITIFCTGKSPEDIVGEMMDRLEDF